MPPGSTDVSFSDSSHASRMGVTFAPRGSSSPFKAKIHGKQRDYSIASNYIRSHCFIGSYTLWS